MLQLDRQKLIILTCLAEHSPYSLNAGELILISKFNLNTETIFLHLGDLIGHQLVELEDPEEFLNKKREYKITKKGIDALDL